LNPPSVTAAIGLYGRLFDLGSYRHLGFRENQYLIVLVIMLGMLLLRLLSTRRFDFSAREGMREPAEILLMGGTIFIVFIFPVSQFIYFQF
jgi:hypothetical protein